MSRSVDSLKAFVAAGGRTPSYRLTPGVVAVGAGKGGVGTSTVSVMLAVEASRRGERVLLVDADENIGSLDLMLGRPRSGPRLGDLRGGVIEPAALLHEVSPGLTLLPGGGGGADATLSGAVGEYRALLRRVAELFSGYSTVVIDGGSRLDSVMAACSAGVERLICVTASDRISLASSYALFKVARARFEALPIELIVNGVDEHQGRNLHSVVRTATQTFLSTDVRFGGTIPTDPGVRSRLEAGTSIAEGGPDGAAMSAAGAVVHRILAERQALLVPEPVVFPLLSAT